MTNNPGWASPGPSDSPEPDDGHRPEEPASPTQKDADTGPAAEQPSAAAGHSSWSQHQPPPGPWHAPSGAEVPGPENHQQAPAAQGWARWAPPTAAGPRWGAPGGGGQHNPWGHPPAPKPGVIPLRPLGVGDMLDGAFGTLRLHWRPVLGVSFVVAVIAAAVNVIVQGHFIDDTRLKNLRDNPNPSAGDILHAMTGAFAGSGLTVLVVVASSILSTAILTMITSRAVLGRPVTLAEAWRDARPRLAPLFGLTLLLPLIGVGVLTVSVLPGALIALSGSESGGVGIASLGLLGGLGVVIWLWVQWSLASPALMLERQGIVAAMKRSTKLVTGSWWRVFGIHLLTVVISYVMSSLIEVPFTGVASAVTGDGFTSFLTSDVSPSWTFLILTSIGAVIGGTITLPITAGVTTLLYLDQRIRRESLDVDLARAANVPGYES